VARVKLVIVIAAAIPAIMLIGDRTIRPIIKHMGPTQVVRRGSGYYLLSSRSY
jgi:hypothetical protein